MKDSTIENLAYLIKQAKEQNLPQPIVFLGAGASKTGGIPLAEEIISDILENYEDNPSVNTLRDEDKTYPKLMECLTPFERNKLLKGYIDRAKINVTHIYLAQLLKEGYVDYVLTVNFDNLMLRALALYNEFPPTYDMAILKDLTTTNFREKSVLYLHGQHHGLWLLNTPEEMDKVKEFIPPILNKIANQRPWIFIGYSGGDPIFDHVVNLGRFDNGLYWACYKDNSPHENVCEKLLDKPNTNAFILKGYDSDSFMLKLNQELGLPQPLIIDKPFTSLKMLLENIVDIDKEKHFRGVKERLEIVKTQVGAAIDQFERGIIKTSEGQQEKVEINRLKKEIINKIVTENFNETEIAIIEKRTRELNDRELNYQLSNLYEAWGDVIFAEAKTQKSEKLYKQSIQKARKATNLNTKNDGAFTTWGLAALYLAHLKNDKAIYKQSIEKSGRAATLNPKNDWAFTNWGAAILNLASIESDESLYLLGIDKSKKAISLNPNNEVALGNWGRSLAGLAKLKNDEGLYRQSIGVLLKYTELSGETYDLACAYALIKDKENAFRHLENSLNKNQVKTSSVENDTDWAFFEDDEDFKGLLDKYKS